MSKSFIENNVKSSENDDGKSMYFGWCIWHHRNFVLISFEFLLSCDMAEREDHDFFWLIWKCSHWECEISSKTDVILVDIVIFETHDPRENFRRQQKSSCGRTRVEQALSIWKKKESSMSKSLCHCQCKNQSVNAYLWNAFWKCQCENHFCKNIILLMPLWNSF